jgi:phage-related tail protein
MSGDHNTNQDYGKRLDKAAEHLGAGALKLIKQILTKHDAAIIEASQEAIETAVLAEREACAKVCDEIVARYRHADDAPEMVAANWCADGVRARGSV